MVSVDIFFLVGYAVWVPQTVHLCATPDFALLLQGFAARLPLPYFLSWKSCLQLQSMIFMGDAVAFDVVCVGVFIFFLVNGECKGEKRDCEAADNADCEHCIPAHC